MAEILELELDESPVNLAAEQILERIRTIKDSRGVPVYGSVEHGLMIPEPGWIPPAEMMPACRLFYGSAYHNIESVQFFSGERSVLLWLVSYFYSYKDPKSPSVQVVSERVTRRLLKALEVAEQGQDGFAPEPFWRFDNPQRIDTEVRNNINQMGRLLQVPPPVYVAPVPLMIRVMNNYEPPA